MLQYNAITGKFDLTLDRALVDGSVTDLHKHSKLVASDGDPDPALSVDADGKVGIGTIPASVLHVKSNTPGVIGSHPAGQIIIQNPAQSMWSNVVITAYESDGDGNPDQQLWYLGSASGSNSDIIFLNRRSSNLRLGTSGIAHVTINHEGKVGIGEPDPETLLELTGTAPYHTLHNSTHEDSDGGRESRLIFKGEKATSGDESTLARIEVSHDGSGADEKGKIVISTNDGDDGDTPSNAVMVDSAQNLVLLKAAGQGIKVDLSAPTFGWRDLLGKVTQRNTGSSKPTHAIYRGALRQFQFAAGKEEYFTYHIDHDHVPNSDIHLHVHWSHIGAFVTGGTITIEYELAYAKGFSRGAFGAPVSTTFPGTASTVQYEHTVSEIQVSAASPDGNQIDSNDLEPDGIIEARIKITSNDITVSEGVVPNPFLHEVDIHYQSTNIGTKSKDPDFYT